MINKINKSDHQFVANSKPGDISNPQSSSFSDEVKDLSLNLIALKQSLTEPKSVTHDFEDFYGKKGFLA